MSAATDVAIIGAGPYGLSIAAHLRKRNIDFRIVGRPMHGWINNMPKGMLLKSAGFSSNLYDPDHAFPFRQYCKERGIPYEDIDFPIPLETFCAYAIAFQRRFVPGVEDDKAALLSPAAEGFEIRLEGGGSFTARKVVVAVGLEHFRHVPRELAHLPDGFVSHSGQHHDLEKFQGKEVLVLGGGSSAIDIAALLHEKRTSVRLIARCPALDFGAPWNNASQPLLYRLRQPVSGIGPGLRSLLWVDAPWLFRYLSDAARIAIARTYLGPSGGWFMKERIQGLPVLLGCAVSEARVCDGRVQLELAQADKTGATMRIQADHVIAATGYRPDVARLPFLDAAILDRLDLIGSTPRLSPRFESSVPGLYFAGPIATTSFGPSMRFMVGSDFTSRKISGHLAKCKGKRRSGRGAAVSGWRWLERRNQGRPEKGRA